ncbi:CaiB/BaiF CoA transferase family protein [Actinomycetospora aeridis]|uniref:CaiB/BaiF CoA-transferase family protein n=1 Tax=Actinomycetospora aeridis TaxID=3129231 RepID=A0ABU8ND44_9PSEU
MSRVPQKPLAGIRVLEVGGYISMPMGGALLSALGADVIKVESTAGDDFRRKDNDRSPYFAQVNAGKRSLAVDLKTPEGLELVKELLPTTDVLFENMRPGKLAALGLGPDVCTALAPDLVFASVNGFGDGGPLRDRPAYDTIGQAYGGIYSLLGEPGQAQLSGTIFADVITGLTSAAGILAALVGRGATGAGVRVDTSLYEAVSVLTTDALSQYVDTGADPSRTTRHPQAQNFCAPTASGENIAVHLSSSEKFWRNLCAAMERPELIEDPRFTPYRHREANYFELVPIVEAEFARRSLDEWEERLTRFDVPFAPVQTMASYVAHPQTEWLELFEPGSNGTTLLRPPWRFDGARPDRGRPTPRIGQHTREIAGEVYDDEQVEKLIATGVLGAEG